eukprot:m.233891 g.233891  ORF g.233891 m.233891 type:complete len:65 (-) comp19304_c0_seq9:933-1127(-)
MVSPVSGCLTTKQGSLQYTACHGSCQVRPATCKCTTCVARRPSKEYALQHWQALSAFYVRVSPQ